MRICYLDCFSGISGDMVVGALVDAGADPSQVGQELGKLRLEGVCPAFEKCARGGIAATKFRVQAPPERKHRHLSDIEELIRRADLPGRVVERSLSIFGRLGQVEARLHQVPLEKVHFHEVGAVDSILDIVGACVGLEALEVEQVYCSALNLGWGSVETQHGLLPVPAPATAALVEGKPVYARGPAAELTTPTGAAIATTLAHSFGPLPPMRLRAAGYGAGERDFREQPNVLRVLIGETSEALEATTVSVMEANIDDQSPQLLGYALERLLEKGALDATLEPLTMKKSRPGILLRVIARPEDQETLAQVMFEETSTLGLRIYTAERRVQARSSVDVRTPWGPVRMKVSESGSFVPEYEDCRRLAAESGAPLKRIFAEANAAYLRSPAGRSPKS